MSDDEVEMDNSQLILRAHAKLNLCLRVLGKRDDGYHEIRSLMVTVNLADTVALSETRVSELVLECSQAGVPSGPDNLSWKAAAALRDYAGVRRGARIWLEKTIPVAAGLGGGSSDAAATLVGLNKLWGTGLTEEELVRVGASVGSDVPFFIRGGLQLAEGRGEKLFPLEGLPQAWFVVVAPPLQVSSAWAYSISKIGLTSATHTNRMTLLGTSLDAAGVAGILQNDLERGVSERYPVVRELKARLLALGATGSLMTGSGPAVFGVAEDETSAARIASSVDRSGLSVFLVTPVQRGWAEADRR